MDVTSCIATHVMPINKIDTGKLIFYDDNSIDFYYKKIMYQLIKEEPEQKYIDEWNEIKKNDLRIALNLGMAWKKQIMTD